MLIWLLYDIKKNKQRQKLFSTCKNFGLFPIQKSVFLGIIDGDRKYVFLEKIQKLTQKEDSVIIMQSSKKNIKESIIFGKNIDLSLPLREKTVIFF